MRNACTIFVGKLEEETIPTGGQLGYEGVNWINLAQNRNQ
jgi:hypothetical protein